MSGFIDESEESTQSLIAFTHRNAGHNTNHEVLRDPNFHLRSDYKVKITITDDFIEFDADEISGAGDHVMHVAIDLPVEFTCLIPKMIQPLWSRVQQRVKIVSETLRSNEKGIVDVSCKYIAFPITFELGHFQLVNVTESHTRFPFFRDRKVYCAAHFKLFKRLPGAFFLSVGCIKQRKRKFYFKSKSIDRRPFILNQSGIFVIISIVG